MTAFTGKLSSMMVLSAALGVSLPSASVRAEQRAPAAKRKSLATALPSGAALAHLKLGNGHSELKNFHAAIAEYKKGALLQPLPVFFFNLGLAYREAGQYQQAVDAFRLYLSKLAGDPLEVEVRGKVEPLIAAMQDALTQPPRSPEPVPLEVERGAAPPPSPPPPSTTRAPAASPAAHSPWYDDRWAWTVAGVGVVTVVAAAVVMVSASSKRDDANSTPIIERQDDLHSQADLRWGVGAGLAITGAALVGTGVILFATPSRSSRETAALRVSPGPGDAGVALSLSF